MSLPIQLCLKLMLVTAQRRSEVITARWVDIDMSSGWWTIPETIAKNKLPHRVALSSLAPCSTYTPRGVRLSSSSAVRLSLAARASMRSTADSRFGSQAPE